MPPSANTNIDFEPLDALQSESISVGGLLAVGLLVMIGIYFLPLRGVISFLLFSTATLLFYTINKKRSGILKSNREILKEFADINGFTYSPSGASAEGAVKDDGSVSSRFGIVKKIVGNTTGITTSLSFLGQYAVAGSKSGTLFSKGHSHKFRHVISGHLSGLPCSTFIYIYTVGSGKNRRTYDAQVMEVTLPRALPHMVIDSLVEAGNGQQSTLPIEFDKSQRIQLEGDFHKYFDLYAPDSYGVTALTIIAPDAMDALLRHAALCDIEIIDNKLYFYWPEIATSRALYESVFKTTQEVLDEIKDKLVRADIFANQTQAVIHASASSGVRLKSSKIGFYVTAAAILGYFVSIFFDGGQSFYGIFYLFIFGSIVAAMIRSARRKRLRNDLIRRYSAS